MLMLYVLVGAVLAGFATLATMDATGRTPRISWLQNDRVIPWLSLGAAGALVLAVILQKHGMAVRLSAATLMLMTLFIFVLAILPFNKPASLRLRPRLSLVRSSPPRT